MEVADLTKTERSQVKGIEQQSEQLGLPIPWQRERTDLEEDAPTLLSEQEEEEYEAMYSEDVEKDNRRTLTDVATKKDQSLNLAGIQSSADQQPIIGDRVQAEANAARNAQSTFPRDSGVSKEFYEREARNAEDQMTLEEIRRRTPQDAELTPEEERMVEEDKRYWAEREHRPDIYERDQNIPDRPILTMADMEGMAPAEKKHIATDDVAVDYFETENGIFAMNNGREVGFALRLSEDPNKGFDVSVSQIGRAHV